MQLSTTKVNSFTIYSILCTILQGSQNVHPLHLVKVGFIIDQAIDDLLIRKFCCQLEDKAARENAAKEKPLFLLFNSFSLAL